MDMYRYEPSRLQPSARVLDMREVDVQLIIDGEQHEIVTGPETSGTRLTGLRALGYTVAHEVDDRLCDRESCIRRDLCVRLLGQALPLDVERQPSESGPVAQVRFLGLGMHVPAGELVQRHAVPPGLGRRGGLAKLPVLIQRDDHRSMIAEVNDLVRVFG